MSRRLRLRDRPWAISGMLYGGVQVVVHITRWWRCLDGFHSFLRRWNACSATRQDLKRPRHHQRRRFGAVIYAVNPIAPGRSPHRMPGYASPAAEWSDLTGDAYIGVVGNGIAESMVGGGCTAWAGGRLPKPPSQEMISRGFARRQLEAPKPQQVLLYGCPERYVKHSWQIDLHTLSNSP